MPNARLLAELSTDLDGFGYSTKSVQQVNRILTRPRAKYKRVLREDFLDLLSASRDEYLTMTAGERDFLSTVLLQELIPLPVLVEAFSGNKFSAGFKTAISDLPQIELSLAEHNRFSYTWDELVEAMISLGWIDATGNKKEV